MICLGTSSKTCAANSLGCYLNLLKGTNCTRSLILFIPLELVIGLSSHQVLSFL